MDENEETRTLLTREETVSRFRQTLPQVLAITVQSLAFLSMGMKDAFPAVVIPVLTNERTNGSLRFSTEEASWFGTVSNACTYMILEVAREFQMLGSVHYIFVGSLMYIMEPIGGLTSGALLQPIGCKNWMILLNIPLLGSWLMAYFATSSTTLCASAALSGFALGLMEAPTVRYASEVSHPSLRGILMTYTSLFVPIGSFLIYFLASIIDWRHVAFVCAFMPIITAISLLLVPETPMWLMSKGRPEAALKSLQWLRGWTTAEMVKDEYKKLEFYNNNTGAFIGRNEVLDEKCDGADAGVDSNAKGKTVTFVSSVNLADIDEQQQSNLSEVWQDLTRRDTLVLLTKCSILFILVTFSARSAMQPYQIQIYAGMKLPMNPNTLAMMLSLVSMAGHVSCLFLIYLMGKKPLGISAFTVNAICLGLLGVYLMLPRPILERDVASFHWLAVVLFAVSNFSSSTGVTPVSMTYLGEILPYRGRGITTGIVKAVYCIAAFVETKTYPGMEQQLGLRNIFFMHAAFCVVGAFFICFALPKTDDRFLSDIELELTHAAKRDAVKHNKR